MSGGSFLPRTFVTRRETAAAIKAEIRQLMVDGIHDRVGHAELLAAGRFFFRHAFATAMGGAFGNDRAQCDHLADVVFQFFEVQWREKYAGMTPQYFLDKVHVPSQLSEKEIEREIDDAWELEIMSDERSMAQHYEGSARTRKGKDLGAKQVR